MNEEQKDNQSIDLSTKQIPPWYISLIPIAILIVLMVLVIRYFGADALSGGSQIALLIASAVVVVISVIFYKTSWKELEESIMFNLKSISTSILILFMIGAIAGTWMISGVVPTLIYYGVQVITPKIFLFATCFICAVVSLLTGSSWTTIATIGVALIGIGSAHGYSAGWTAGAIISGAYFGDKISPLSDTTVLASSTTRTPLFTHIKYMMITTTPSFIITLIIFLIVSLTHNQSEGILIGEFTSSLKSTFNISPFLLLIPVITGICIAKKLPALHTLFISAIIAGLVALFAQSDLIAQIGGAIDGEKLNFANGFKGFFITIYGSTNIDTGSEILNALVATRGMAGMLSTIFLIIVASTFSGVLIGSKMIRSITEILMRFVSKTVSVVASTVGCGIFCNLTMGDQYLSIILTSSLYGKLYEKRGLETRLLSRSAEDSATVTSVLIPWNSCGMTQATVLKTPTLEYIPYCFFNIISPLMSIFIAAIGYKIVRKK